MKHKLLSRDQAMYKTNTKKLKGRQSRKGKEYGSFRILDKETGYKLQLSIKEAAEFVGKGQQYVRVAAKEDLNWNSGNLNLKTKMKEKQEEGLEAQLGL